ncbi:urease subunit gamma, partial [Streptomyces sp.]|uniref:urease subunit gamma n=1 Tax=Streptomyces sp. TaxID=1931 RepID=UPI002F93E9AA
MPLTPTERDRLLLFTAAELARARRARGLKLNVPEATALIADTVCEAARDGLRLAEAIERGRTVLSPDDVLPGVVDVVTEVHVEAVFEDGSRLAAIGDPFGAWTRRDDAPGAVRPVSETVALPVPDAKLTVRNTAAVPVSVTSHFHFFEANPRLDFDRAAAYGMRLCVPAGSSFRFDPGG